MQDHAHEAVWATLRLDLKRRAAKQRSQGGMFLTLGLIASPCRTTFAGRDGQHRLAVSLLLHSVFSSLADGPHGLHQLGQPPTSHVLSRLQSIRERWNDKILINS